MTAASFFLTASYMFAMVAARAFQQLNVVHSQYRLVPPTSFVMAAMECALVLNTVTIGIWACLPMGIGGSLGCWFAMWLHRRARHGS